jgi:hypothetical protein
MAQPDTSGRTRSKDGERGAAPGAALDDWLTAERQVDWRD